MVYLLGELTRKREASIKLKFAKMTTKQFLGHCKCISRQKLGKAVET